MVKKVSTFSLLNKMNLRTFIYSKFQFLAVIFITAIAMCLYVGLTSNASSISNRINSLYEESNVADIWITVSSNDSEDYDNLSSIIGNNGTIEERFSISSDINSYSSTALIYESLPSINAAVDTDNTSTDEFFIFDYRLLDATDVSFLDSDGNYKSIPVSLSWVTYRNALSSAIFEGIDFSVMDVLNALVMDGKTNIFNTTNLTLNITPTGTMRQAENVQSALLNTSSFLLSQQLFLNTLYDLIDENFAVPTSVSVGDEYYTIKLGLLILDQYLNVDVIQVLKDAVASIFTPNQYIIKLNDSSLADSISDQIEEYFYAKEDTNLLLVTTLDNQSFNMVVQNDITQAEQLAYIFPIVFFLVAILVVLTTISQIIIKDRITIGTMKALGLTNRQIIIHYMSLATLIVFTGIIIGLILGPLIIPYIMNQKYAILYSLPAMSYTISVLEAVISSIVVILATAVVTYFVIRKSIKLNPAQSMRNTTTKTIKAPKNERFKDSKLIPLKMAIRNIRLNITKSLMVIIGVCGCSALLVCGFGIDDTLNYGIDIDTSIFFNADAFITYSSTTSSVDEVLSIEGVNNAEEYTYLPASITFDSTSYDSYVYVLSDNSSFFPIEDNDIYEKIAVSKKIADQLDISVGDTISFTSFGLTFEGEVGIIMEVTFMHGIYINSAYNNYSELYEYKTNAWVEIDEDYDVDEVITNILEVENVATCISKQESIDNVDSIMSSIEIMTLAIRIFAILLAVVVLYNLCLLNYKERARDIATLKVLGFSRFEIATSLFIESLALTIIGVAFGMLLGMPMEILVLMVNTTPLVEFIYIVYPLSYLYAVLITFGTAVVVNLFLTHKIKKVQMVEALKSIE